MKVFSESDENVSASKPVSENRPERSAAARSTTDSPIATQHLVPRKSEKTPYGRF
jgi:hypothetical protein